MNNAPAAVIENKNTNTVILAIIVAKMEGWTVHVRSHSQETLALVTGPERDRRKNRLLFRLLGRCNFSEKSSLFIIVLNAEGVTWRQEAQ